jgi:hypothetical protein
MFMQTRIFIVFPFVRFRMSQCSIGTRDEVLIEELSGILMPFDPCVTTNLAGSGGLAARSESPQVPRFSVILDKGI